MKDDLTSPSVTLLGDVSFGVSHRRCLLRWHFSVTSHSVVLLEATELSLCGSLEIESLLVLSLGGSSPPSFPSVAQIEAFTSNRKIEGTKFIEQRFKQFRSSLHNKLGMSKGQEPFGRGIGAYYNASPKVVGLPKREQTHCKQRWGKLNEGVCKFVGSYEAATKQRTSGQSEDDVLKAAHEIFLNDYKVKFSLEHAWRELRNYQKWCGTYGSSQQSSGSKRKRVGEDQSFQSSASMPRVNGEDEATARPIGVKASKAKAKRSVGEEGKNLQDFQQMWELKAKDITAKEKLSQTKLLDKLLAKTEPLSDLEVALKNKLIKNMLYMGSSHTQPEMEPRKRIVCGLSARGIIPLLSEEDRDDDVVPLPQEDTVEVVEISDEEEEDMVELSSEEYMSNMGYLIRVEESEDDIEPEFRRMLERMKEEEKKLREEKFRVLKSGIKLEKGQSSKGDGNKRKRRSVRQDKAFDDAFDDAFDELFDQQFDQAFHNFTIQSDEEERRKKRKKRAYIERHREEGHFRLWNDYLSESPTYPENFFRRRFRMNKRLFMHIVDRLSNEVQYFREKKDGLRRNSLSPLQKCTAAIRVLAYGYAANMVDEYLRLGETTAPLCVEQFVEGIIYLFGDEYLRRPTPADLQRLLDVGERRGFPGMIGSIDCMHWEWKNCLTAWKGQYSRGSGKPTIVLEAVASYNLWIWHVFFGPPGTLNDINVLDRSPVFDDIINGQAPNVTYFVNEREYHMAYYLTDGIYLKWATFIQSISMPQVGVSNGLSGWIWVCPDGLIFFGHFWPKPK
uniref:Uncharacterized protein n=1 Tax=Brassica oleracea var. oleracea TaxID=109376 RepID=A0A0D3A6X5_BRAOL